VIETRDPDDGEKLRELERKIRILSLLANCERIGYRQINGAPLHVLAFLCDALAPVWNLPVIDLHLLKRRVRPFSPLLQRDLDRLIGQGLVTIVRFEYERSDEGDEWLLDADYALDHGRFGPIQNRIAAHPEQQKKFDFVREVVYAASGLGVLGISGIGAVDATYSNPLIDVGGLINLSGDPTSSNPTAQAANRFSELRRLRDGEGYSAAESVHLYVRHLYTRMSVA
jgi:hypothetical protein